MEHFSELRQLLHSGHYENDARQPINHRSTRARPAQQPDSLVFSAQQHSAARPPLTRSGAAAATRSRRPPAAPMAHPPFVGQGSVRVPVSRPAATRNDVDLYLAQLNHQQPSEHHHHSTRHASTTAAVAAAAHQPAPEQHRRAKRGKPMARRSLQALFDLAAEDSSTWQTSASTAGDTEDDGDTGMFASATSGDISSKQQMNGNNNNSCSLFPGLSEALLAVAAAAAGIPGPSTPANCDSGFLGEATTVAGAVAVAGATPACRPQSPLDAAASVHGVTANKNIQDHLSSIVPLRHLLMSDRGRKLTAVEAKAIILRVAEDLAALHAANTVHRRVSIESISLTTCLADSNGTVSNDGASPSTNTNSTAEIAVAILPPGRSAAVLGSNRCYWALKDPGYDAHHAPPEVACCPVDRPVAFTPAGDMWGLGVVLFSLLSAGRAPFTAPSCLCGGSVEGGKEDGEREGTLTSTVDALQRHLYSHLHCQIDVINQLSAAQAAGAAGSTEEDALEMTAIGFDTHAQKLLLGLLHADPAQRYSAIDVLNHPWVAEAIPFVPKMQPSSLPFAKSNTAGGVGTTANGTGRESTPPMSDVLRRTEQLGFTPQSTSPLVPAGAAAECPYPIIGHVAQPLEVLVAGRKVTISALHAVYDVPGYGAMMSAAPLAVADPAEVSAAAAAAAANGHVMPATASAPTAAAAGGAVDGHDASMWNPFFN